MKNKTLSQISHMQVEDIAEIDSWQTKFAGSEKFESIKKHMEHESLEFAECVTESEPARKITSLTDLIDAYYITQVSDPNYDPMEEDFLAYVMRDNEGKIVLFSIFNFRDLISHHNPVFIDTLVVHPEEQNKGYAKKFLTAVFENQEKFFGWKPDEFFTSFAPDNIAAKKLFSRFGFDIKQTEKFASAQTYAPKLVSETQPGSGEQN